MKRLVMIADPTKKSLPTLLLLALALVALGGACRRQPAAVEVKGPILEMTVATGYDDKGNPQNASFAFAPTEPQLMVIVQIGRLDAGEQAAASSVPFFQFETVAAAEGEPVLNIAWYSISDEGEQKLFEHQVKVQPYDRAYSVGKSKGTLKAGSYKVRASLAGQAQQTELEVRQAKAETSSRTPPQASVNPASAVASSGDADQGEPPADGGSGTIPRQSGAGDTFGNPINTSPTSCTFRIYYPTNRVYARADKVFVGVKQHCPDPDNYGPVEVMAMIAAPGSSSYLLGVLPDPPKPDPLNTGASRSWQVDPCRLEEGSDLPGTKIEIRAHRKDVDSFSDEAEETFTLGPDQDKPKVSVNSSPAKGTKVKPGDVIKIDATASERREGGTWQTGVQMFQLTGPEGLIKEDTDVGRLPKPCEKKSWSKVIEASYKVPKNPPPIIKLCAIAEDYVGNGDFRCGEFPTGDVWKGNMRSQSLLSMPSGTCSGEYETTLTLVVGSDGSISGRGLSAAVKPLSCTFRSTPQWLKSVTMRVEGKAYEDRFEIRLIGETFSTNTGAAGYEHAGYITNFSPYTSPHVIPITGPGVAEGHSNASAYGTAVQNKFRLRCETCVPRVASRREHPRRKVFALSVPDSFVISISLNSFDEPKLRPAPCHESQRTSLFRSLV